MITDFLDYERKLSSRFLVPLLNSLGVNLKGKSVLDVGCGYGGVLAVLSEQFSLSEAVGIDVDAHMLQSGLDRAPPGLRLETGDFFSMNAQKYDFILMRDVLEHIVDVEKALLKAASLLNPSGMIYVSFAPFHSPFGGHQHNGAGFFSNIPWLQLLPERWFRELLSMRGNSYKTASGLQADMESVLRTRLSISGFETSLSKANLGVKYYAQHLIRPDYQIKFGLPSLRFPRVRGLEELLCTGIEALLVNAPRKM